MRAADTATQNARFRLLQKPKNRAAFQMQEANNASIQTASSRTPWTRFVSGVVFPLQEKLKRHDSHARLRFLESSQWWQEDQLTRHRLAGLKNLLSCAGRHVPYYRSLFRQTGFQPGDLTTLADLERLPFLTKPLIRSSELRSEVAGPLQRF